MSRQQRLIFYALIIGAFYLYTKNSNLDPNEPVAEPAIEREDGTADVIAAKMDPPQSIRGQGHEGQAQATEKLKTTENSGEALSVRPLVKLFDVTEKPIGSIDQFLQRIRSIENQDYEDPLDPFFKRQGSEEDGHLYIVRTAGALPSTRNLHAQFMTNETGELEAQHISFDIEASEGGFERAVAIVKGQFSQLGSPSEIRPGFAKWSTVDGAYIIWVNQVSEDQIQDLINDPFSAYSETDVGLIQVAIEQEIH